MMCGVYSMYQLKLHSNPIITIITPFLQMRKLGHREAKQLARVTQLVRFKLSWDVSPVIFTQESVLLTDAQFWSTASQKKGDNPQVTDATLLSTGSLLEKVKEHGLNRRFPEKFMDMDWHRDPRDCHTRNIPVSVPIHSGHLNSFLHHRGQEWIQVSAPTHEASPLGLALPSWPLRGSAFSPDSG